MGNWFKFREIYIVRLVKAVEEHPADYFYGIAEVPRVVDKMMAAMKEGSANIHDSPAIKGTCRELGIKCTHKSVKEYLNG